MTVQKTSDKLPSYPPENHYRSDVVYQRGRAIFARKRLGLQSAVTTKHNSCMWHLQLKPVTESHYKNKTDKHNSFQLTQR